MPPATRAEELLEMHNGTVVELQASTLIRIAGAPFIVLLFMVAIYLHYIQFTVVMVGSLFVVIPCITAVCFLFSKYTRDYIGRKVLLDIYGFDSTASCVIEQFCTPWVATRSLTQEFERTVRVNPEDPGAGATDKQQLVLLRQQASESFASKINKRIQERLDECTHNPSICITGTLETRIY
jgi:hypothetical protein